MHIFGLKGKWRMKKKLIVIEGLDGSGKNTQAKKLKDWLARKNQNVKMVSFPDYNSNSSALVKMYLSGDFGTDPDSVNPYAASSFFAVDRFASFKTNWQDFYENSGIIIADRYTTSNGVHQCSKLPKEDWDKFLDWLFCYEYKYMQIPEPDQVIYLEMDINESQNLIRKRYENDESKKDIHERDTDYLRKSAEAANYCAEKYNWKTVNCIKNGHLRSIDDIFDEASRIAENYFSETNIF